MTLPVPADRPFLSDNWAFNERADCASLTRLLAAWEHNAFAYDLGRTPSDGVVVSPTTGAFVQGTDNQVTNSSGPKFLGEFFVPAPLTFAHRLEVWVRGAISASGSTGGTIILRSRATGRTEYATLNNTSMGGTAGWIQMFVQASPGDVVEVWLSHNSTTDGTTVSITCVCAWWEPLDGLRPDVTIEDAAASTFVGLSQTYFDSADVPDSTHQLRWLIRKANTFAGHRPRVVYAKWFGQVAASSPPGTGIVGRDLFYKVFVGDRILSVSVWLTLFRSQVGVGIARADVYWDGALQGNIAVDGFWGGPVSINNPTKGLHELRIQAVANDNGSGATATCKVNGVTCFEATVNGLPLATGDAVPASFQTISDELISSGLPMRRDLAPGSRAVGRRALIRNMYWLWSNRYKRHLVADSTYHDGPTGAGYAIFATAPPAQTMGTYFSNVFDTQPLRPIIHACRLNLGRAAPTAFDVKVQVLGGGQPSVQIPIDGLPKRVGGMGSLTSSTMHWHSPPVVLTNVSASTINMEALSVSDAQSKNHSRAAGAAFAVNAPLPLP